MMRVFGQGPVIERLLPGVGEMSERDCAVGGGESPFRGVEDKVARRGGELYYNITIIGIFKTWKWELVLRMERIRNRCKCTRMKILPLW